MTTQPTSTELVWCENEAHDGSARTAHHMTPECVHPHYSGQYADPMTGLALPDSALPGSVERAEDLRNEWLGALAAESNASIAAELTGEQLEQAVTANKAAMAELSKMQAAAYKARADYVDYLRGAGMVDTASGPRPRADVLGMETCSIHGVSPVDHQCILKTGPEFAAAMRKAEAEGRSW